MDDAFADGAVIPLGAADSGRAIGEAGCQLLPLVFSEIGHGDSYWGIFREERGESIGF